MNIFQRIGNNIEKEKLKKKRFSDNYWKLSASERMDYDLRREVKDYRPNIFDIFLNACIYLIVFMLISSLFIPQIFNLFFTQHNYFMIINILVFFFFLELILLIFYPSINKKSIENLNKRFKL